MIENNEQRLLDMLPPRFAALRQMQAIAKAEAEQFDHLDRGIDGLLEQGFIKTATWGLQFWEQRFLLPVLNQDTNWEERRSRVLAAKRGTKASLIEIARAVEPSLSLAWGRLILAFTITSNDSEPYNFGPLINIIEKEKPSHLTYSFRVRPNGYTVLANKVGRNQVSLRLLCGTAKAGVWSRRATEGKVISKDFEIETRRHAIARKYPLCGQLLTGTYPSISTFANLTNSNINISSARIVTPSKAFDRGIEFERLLYNTKHDFNITGNTYVSEEVKL